MKGFRTYLAREEGRRPQWWLVDAEGQTLGRMATRIATILRGKHRPHYCPSQDLGDHVVVVNAARLNVTGNKLAEKRYYRHSGYPGGLSERTLEDMLARHPERVVRLAVHGMLPRGKLRSQLLGKLKVYARGEHPHQAQAPRAWPVAERREESES